MKHRKRAPEAKRSRDRQSTESVSNPSQPRVAPKWMLAAIGAVIVVAFLAWSFRPLSDNQGISSRELADSSRPVSRSKSERASTQEPAQPFIAHNWLYLWGSEQPEVLLASDKVRGEYSNIAPGDYVKPKTCVECHKEQFQAWTDSPHAKMNQTASQESVIGDFQEGTIEYDGGRMRSFAQDGRFFMETTRGKDERTYQITRTIGSRFFQYYVGKVVAGDPLPGQSHLVCSDDHPLWEVVLPFGFWLKKEQWVPVYDVFEFVDDDRTQASDENEYDVYGNFQVKPYYFHCGRCHTTMPEGYRMLWDPNPELFRKPRMHLSLWKYLEETIDEMAPGVDPHPNLDGSSLGSLIQDYCREYGPDHAATLGISCESCHYGGRVHAESEGKIKPHFTTSSPHLSVPGRKAGSVGRNALNVNLTCSKCHSALRRVHPSGEIAKNSSEFLDAVQGTCYSVAKCSSCHDPHEATGRVWPKTPEQDDQSCIACHEKYSSPEKIAAHTHHPVSSSGSRCMNCHMPKVTEGLQDLVRTHRIDSPTRDEVVYEGGVNACNLCHLEKSMEWTVKHFTSWYGREYDWKRIKKGPGSSKEPTGRVWLSDENDKVSLAAIGAAKQQKAKWLLPELVNKLDDPLLIHRQFAMDTIESITGRQLDSMGYQFWLTPEERTESLMEALRGEFVSRETEMQ